MLVGGIGDDNEILGRDDWQETLESGADETLARAQDVEKLLGLVVFAQRPEAAPDAARHNDTVLVAHKNCKCWSIDAPSQRAHIILNR